MRNLVRAPTVLLSTLLLVGTAAADSTVVISMAGEAFDGAPAFEVRIGDRVIGRGILDKAIDTVADGRIYRNAAPAKYLQEFTYTIDDTLPAPAAVTIALTNDKFVPVDDGHDRNVFVNFVEVNGLKVGAADITVLRGPKKEVLDRQAGFVPLYENVNRAVAQPPATGWPKAKDRAPADLAERSSGALTAPSTRLVVLAP